MQIEPINLPELFGVIMGTAVVLFPMLALSIRIALRPLFEAMAKARADGASARVQLLEERVALLENKLQHAAPAPGLSSSEMRSMTA